MQKKHIIKSPDQINLEGDGFLENLFNYLWTRDPVFGTVPCVNVPDTVIINYDQPLVWFFMHKGILRKKGKSKLKIEVVIEHFNKKEPACGIVAVFIKTTLNETTGQKNIVFEYFQKQELIDFFAKKNQLHTGILQKFVQPKGDHNFMIRAVWSPNLCLFERKESIKKINDRRIDMYERVFTYEGGDFHTTTAPLKGYVLPNSLQKIAYNIVSHVANVSFDRTMIARMVLNFKIDDHDRIWLLFCSSLRLAQSTKSSEVTNLGYFDKTYEPLDLDIKLNSPQYINANLLSTGKPLNIHNLYKCAKCQAMKDPQSTFEMSYKIIIEGYEFDHLQSMAQVTGSRGANRFTADKLHLEVKTQRTEAKTVRRGPDSHWQLAKSIPPLIKAAHPRLKEETYRYLRSDPSFLKRTALVCEDCCLEIQKSKDGQLGPKQLDEDELLGIGRLRPELTNQRFQHTTRNIQLKKEADLGESSSKTQPLLSPKTFMATGPSDRTKFEDLKEHNEMSEEDSGSGSDISSNSDESNEEMCIGIKLKSPPHKKPREIMKPMTSDSNFNKPFTPSTLPEIGSNTSTPMDGTFGNRFHLRIRSSTPVQFGSLLSSPVMSVKNGTSKLSEYLLKPSNSISLMRVSTANTINYQRPMSVAENYKEFEGDYSDKPDVPDKKNMTAYDQTKVIVKPKKSLSLPKKQYIKRAYSNLSRNSSNPDTIDKLLFGESAYSSKFPEGRCAQLIKANIDPIYGHTRVKKQ